MSRPIVVAFIILCFSSCGPQKDISETFLNQLVTDSINLIGKDVPNAFSYENKNKFIKKIEKSNANPAEIIITLTVNSGIVESCDLSIIFLDSGEARLYYNHVTEYFENKKWNFIRFISKYKRPNGALYLKNDMYCGIYEPTPYTIPMCFSKNINLNNFYEDQPEMIIDTKKLFEDLNSSLPVEKMPIEYYKNIILQDETSQRYLELKGIAEIEYLIPGFLCFIVEWEDFEGYVYKLYTFNNNSNIIDIYSCGNGYPMPYYKIVTQNIQGNRFGDCLIIQDINNDEINEIISFSFWTSPIIIIYGFDVLENRFKTYLEAQYFINYDDPVPPIRVEKNNNISEFVILKIIDEETYDLGWVKYTYDNEKRIYKK
jgi:hypothetical protein